MYPAEFNNTYTRVPATDGTISRADAKTKKSRGRFQQSYTTDEEQHQDATRSLEARCSATFPSGFQTKFENFQSQRASAVVRQRSLCEENEGSRDCEHARIRVAQLRGEVRIL